RIAVGEIGFRAAATLHLFDTGLVIDRVGASPLWIAAGSLLGARTAPALAGKVMGGDGLLVIRWRLDGHELDTGFRGDDRDVYPQWTEQIGKLVGAQGKAQ